MAATAVCVFEKNDTICEYSEPLRHIQYNPTASQQGRTIVVTYNREHHFWRELVEHADEPKVVATLDYLVFALANAELLVPEQARIAKENLNTTLVGLLV